MLDSAGAGESRSGSAAGVGSSRSVPSSFAEPFPSLSLSFSPSFLSEADDVRSESRPSAAADGVRSSSPPKNPRRHVPIPPTTSRMMTAAAIRGTSDQREDRSVVVTFCGEAPSAAHAQAVGVWGATPSVIGGDEPSCWPFKAARTASSCNWYSQSTSSG